MVYWCMTSIRCCSDVCTFSCVVLSSLVIAVHCKFIGGSWSQRLSVCSTSHHCWPRHLRLLLSALIQTRTFCMCSGWAYFENSKYPPPPPPPPPPIIVHACENYWESTVIACVFMHSLVWCEWSIDQHTC